MPRQSSTQGEQPKRFYQLTVNDEATEADLNIYGDICDYAWEAAGQTSAVTLSRQLDVLPTTIDRINVHISSYGGSVKEGLAIYNALKRHSAQVVTTCDSMACSIASVIFMAGDVRIMSESSLLMIHNAYVYTCGNAAELHKAADDVDKINDASVAAYMAHVNIGEPQLRGLMDAESWLSAEDALDMGFATAISSWSVEDTPTQSVRSRLAEIIAAAQKAEADPDEDDEDDETGGNEEDEKDEDEDDEDDTSKQLADAFAQFLRTIKKGQDNA